ncbi:hypothetical protein ABB37_03227 [Leptomonas pyrrhocoris]|uniref:Uncharacterized protein n=1 Tax=Leptomonas pyrrhocoris TaxID=157538 RepID=A0A0N1J4Z9_LEPPY|nr:hypothetical protein ABB37_03227 [Leptomonas pyrrhocoris]KPA82064.1 hypothetical protein ABB37_03227 [Leptomonas pyrrhocoris]|eukprot:XP_015660503.1 hypothetical protein ABB37_03227 [Leptomonas pyrrhocoris]
MQQHFRANGALQQLKTQLRGMMLTDLMQHPQTARMLVDGAAQSIPPSPSSSSLPGQGRIEDRAVGLQRSSIPDVTPAALSDGRAIAAVPRRSDHTLQTWSCGLADALVENHLRRTRRAMSLSIFSTEAEVPPFSTSGAPSEEEEYLAHLFCQTSVDGSPTAASKSAAAEEEDFLTPSPSRSVKSVLQRLVEDCVTRQGLLSGSDGAARHLHSCSTQTEAADSTDSATNPLNSLECRLAAVDAKYALTFAQLKRTGATGEQPFFLRSEVERRLAQYKGDMHAQLRSEYEQKYNAFTRVQLQEARDEAEQRYRVLARNKTEEFAEMERSVVARLEQERERLKLSWEDVHQQRAEMERRQRDTMTQLADREAAQQQKEAELQKAKETCRMLRLQCAKWEELCATRLMELDGARSREERRMEDLRRLQAEHASELRLKDEEVSRLRYRMRLLAREVEVPTATTPAAGEEASPAKPTTGTSTTGSPADPKQLYGLLLRTEELQRNAVLQQQQQQQRWDAAWVASAATATPAETDAAGAQASAVAAAPSSSSAPPQNAALLGSHSAHADTAGMPTRVNNDGAGSGQPTISALAAVEKPSSTSEVSDTALQTAFAPTTASPLLSTVGEANKTTEVVKGAAAAAAASGDAKPASSLPASPPLPPPLAVAPQPGVSRQTSASTITTASAKTSHSRSAPAKASSSSRSSAGSSPASKSSKVKSSSTSLSATPQKTPDREKGTPTNSAADTAGAAVVLHEAEKAEGESRKEIAADEGTARAGIAWSEKNARRIAVEALKQAKRSSDDDSSRGGGGGITRPWGRLAMGGGAQATPAAGGGTVFDDTFSTDDDALIRSSSEDASDF